MWAHLGAVGQFGAMLAHLGAMLAHLGAMGLCSPFLTPMLAHVDPSCATSSEKGEKMRRAQNTVKRGTFWPDRVGRRLGRPFGYATARGPLAGFKRLRATAGQGPNYVGRFCGLCWPMLAYLAGNVGPSLWLCWPMLASCGSMLSQKIRKMGTAKKTL